MLVKLNIEARAAASAYLSSRGKGGPSNSFIK
jgi:hypothetical protein